MERTIYITEDDLTSIRHALQNPGFNNLRNRPYIQQLNRELERAVICPSGEIPPDVITMDSRVVLLDLESGEAMDLTLVYPGKPQDAAAGEQVSVLAPIGMAMLGYRAGDVFVWETPGGVRQLKVKSVLYQPESAARGGQA